MKYCVIKNADICKRKKISAVYQCLNASFLFLATARCCPCWTFHFYEVLPMHYFHFTFVQTLLSILFLKFTFSLGIVLLFLTITTKISLCSLMYQPKLFSSLIAQILHPIQQGLFFPYFWACTIYWCHFSGLSIYFLKFVICPSNNTCAISY